MPGKFTDKEVNRMFALYEALNFANPLQINDRKVKRMLNYSFINMAKKLSILKKNGNIWEKIENIVHNELPKYGSQPLIVSTINVLEDLEDNGFW